MLNDVGQCAGLECYDRSAGSESFHRNQRACLSDKAWDKKAARGGQKSALAQGTDSPQKSVIRVLKPGLNLIPEVLLMRFVCEKLSPDQDRGPRMACRIQTYVKAFFGTNTA